MGLPQKQERFVQEYLVDLNATQAAVRAGYRGSTGSRLLARPEVAAAVDRAMEERARRTEVTQDRVIRELAAIAFAKATDHTRVSEDGQVEVLPTQAWPEGQARAAASIKAGRYGVTVSNYDKLKALELLGKHLGMFDGRGSLEVEENDLLERLMEGLSEEDEVSDLE